MRPTEALQSFFDGFQTVEIFKCFEMNLILAYIIFSLIAVCMIIFTFLLFYGELPLLKKQDKITLKITVAVSSYCVFFVCFKAKDKNFHFLPDYFVITYCFNFSRMRPS